MVQWQHKEITNTTHDNQRINNGKKQLNGDITVVIILSPLLLFYKYFIYLFITFLMHTTESY